MWSLEFYCLRVCVCVLSRSVMSDLLGPHELQLARPFCPSDFPGKNTGVGCRSQELNPRLLHLQHWQADSLPLNRVVLLLLNITGKMYKVSYSSATPLRNLFWLLIHGSQAQKVLGTEGFSLLDPTMYLNLPSICMGAGGCVVCQLLSTQTSSVLFLKELSDF